MVFSPPELLLTGYFFCPSLCLEIYVGENPRRSAVSYILKPDSLVPCIKYVKMYFLGTTLNAALLIEHYYYNRIAKLKMALPQQL